MSSVANNAACIIICNLQGQELLKEKLNSSTQNISISALKAGVYFVNMQVDGIIQTKKLIKMQE